MKKALVVLVVIVLLVIVADFVLRSVAENAAARMIDDEIAQEVDPEVDLGGFPFLRSVLTGTFEEITITVPEAAEGALVVEDIRLTLQDVRLEPLEVLAGRGDLRAASLEGRGIVSEATINDIVGARTPDLTVSIEKDRVAVSNGELTVPANAIVAGNRILFGAGELAEGFEIPLPALLPDVQFSALRATPGELVLQVIGSRLRIRT